MEANYSSVPEENKPFRTLIIITVIALGFGYLWYTHKKISNENE